jgi:hypothetical protein
MWQVDKAGGNITVATACSYPCDRLYPGNSLLAYTTASQRLGFTTMLAITDIPNPLPPGTQSETFPYVSLDSSLYLNITVACWPPAYDNLVSCLARRLCLAPPLSLTCICMLVVPLAGACMERACGIDILPRPA